MSVNGGTHPCYIYYQRLVTCIKKELMPNKMCMDQTEDYLECKKRRKHVGPISDSF